MIARATASVAFCLGVSGTSGNVVGGNHGSAVLFASEVEPSSAAATEPSWSARKGGIATAVGARTGGAALCARSRGPIMRVQGTDEAEPWLWCL